MSPENIGALLDKLVYIGLGICMIYLSIKQKEKLGKKAAFVMVGGIVSILYAIFLFVVK